MPNINTRTLQKIGLIAAAAAVTGIVGYLSSNPVVLGAATPIVVLVAREIDLWLEKQANA